MIEINNIVSGYGKKTVLKGFSLELKKGELLSVIGPNGSGKSTLLKTVCGILPLTGGDVLIDGKSIFEYSKRELSLKIAYLSQDSIFPDMTAFEYILQGRYPHVGIFGGYGKEDISFAEHVMEKMGILFLKDKRMCELSGGMRQRVNIASALVTNPDYILLDEPCAYLDPGVQLELMRFLKTLAFENGKGIALVMHDTALAFNLSDRIAVINDGKIVMADSPENAFESGAHEEIFGVELLKNNDSDYYLSYK